MDAKCPNLTNIQLLRGLEQRAEPGGMRCCAHRNSLETTLRIDDLPTNKS